MDFFYADFNKRELVKDENGALVDRADHDAALAAKDAKLESCTRARRAAEEEVGRLRSQLADATSGLEAANKAHRDRFKENERLQSQLAELRRALAAYETPEGVAMLMERQGWKHGEALACLALLYCATDAAQQQGEMAVDLMREAFDKAESAMPLLVGNPQAREEKP